MIYTDINTFKQFLEECREYTALSNSDKKFLQEKFPMTYAAIKGVAGKNPSAFIKVLIKESKLPNGLKSNDHVDEISQVIFPELSKSPANPNYGDKDKIDFHGALLSALNRTIIDLRAYDHQRYTTLNNFCIVSTNFDKYSRNAAYDNSVFCLCIYLRNYTDMMYYDDVLTAYSVYRWSCAMANRALVYTADDYYCNSNILYNRINYELRNGNLHAANDVIPVSLLMKAPNDEKSAVAKLLDDLGTIQLHQNVLVLASSTGVDLDKVRTNVNARFNCNMKIVGSSNTELDINRQLTECKEPMFAFGYTIDGSPDCEYIGLILNCDHLDALLCLTHLKHAIDKYGELDSEPCSNYVMDFLLGREQGFSDSEGFGYGWFSKPSDIIEAAEYADTRDKEYEWTK